MSNQSEYNAKRQLYMSRKISHQDFYQWLAGFIGATKADMPVSEDQIMRSEDPHLNDIPLRLWDSKDFDIRNKAYAKSLNWSLSDTVCTLKAIAHSLKE